MCSKAAVPVTSLHWCKYLPCSDCILSKLSRKLAVTMSCSDKRISGPHITHINCKWLQIEMYMIYFCNYLELIHNFMSLWVHRLHVKGMRKPVCAHPKLKKLLMRIKGLRNHKRQATFWSVERKKWQNLSVFSTVGVSRTCVIQKPLCTLFFSFYVIVMCASKSSSSVDCLAIVKQQRHILDAMLLLANNIQSFQEVTVNIM